MRKFNVDEFIWLLILILSTMFVGYLMASGYIYQFLSVRSANNLYLTLIIFPILIIVQLFKVITFNSKRDNSLRYLPIILTLMVGISIVLKNYSLSENFDINNHKFKSSIANKAIEISYENHHIIEDINKDGKDFLGKYIIFTGFVYRNEENKKFILAREEMNCCVADSVVVGIDSFCEDNLKEGQWIKALGKIDYNGRYYFKIIEYININPPKDQYY